MNNESTWKECVETNAAINITPDKLKAQSLIETAKGRNKFLSEIKIKEENSCYIFENYYSSLLEMLHALILLKGYKVNNHICIGYYLRDVLNNEELFRNFDECRYKRNSLIYYGKKLEFNNSKVLIEKCKNLIEDIKILIKENK